MAATTGVSVEEYLRMSFDGADCEYVDGEVVERNMGDGWHSAIQARLIEVFFPIRQRTGLWALPELRHRVLPTRYRIPDIAVYREKPRDRVPSEPPFVAIEIVSPDDRMSRMTAKLQEYRDWGVPHVWVIDPDTRQLWTYVTQGLVLVPRFELPEVAVEISAGEIFSALD